MNTARKKIALNASLESHIFQERLSKNEQERLKKICFQYQNFAPEIWTEKSYRPYSQYFGFINALKTKAVLEEIERWGYFRVFHPGVQLIDLGAGTLGASLGAFDFLKEKQIEIAQLSAIDSHPEVVRWAAQTYADFLPSRVQISSEWKEPPSNSLILMANVWNENLLAPSQKEIRWNESLWKKVLKSIQEADESQIFVFIEPASHKINERFLELRDFLSQHTHILLPCTHQLPCPARKQAEWCHEEKIFRAPNEFWNIVSFLGFRQRVLSYSMLVVGKQRPAFSSSHARIVSSDVGGKGKSEKWLCAQGLRWKHSILDRHRCPQNESFFEGRRGSIIDCVSTPPEQQD